MSLGTVREWDQQPGGSQVGKATHVRRLRYVELAVLVSCLGLVLVVNRAVPFVTLAQQDFSLGWIGFAEDLATHSLLHPHATSMGYPAEVPLAFGLTAVIPMAILIRAGLNGPDAYVLVEAMVLLIAFLGARALARMLGAGWWLAAGSATLWLILPIVWVTSAQYMMVGWGFALLPGMFLAVVASLRRSVERRHPLPGIAALIGLPILSAFLDGYSFVMFAFGAWVLIFGALISQREYARSHAAFVALPFAAGCFLGYLAYSRYSSGLPQVVSPSLDVFRAFGSDLLFVATPTQGVIWSWDALGVSTPRDAYSYWGDESIWSSSFSIVMLVGAVAAAIWAIPRRRLALWLVCLMSVALYLALGPSLKINSQIPGAAGPSIALTADLATMPLGSSWIFDHVPGVESMRATYRWLALGMFGAWGLITIGLSAVTRRSRALGACLMVLLLLAHLPNVDSALSEGRQHLGVARQVDSELVPALRSTLNPGDRVIYAPAGNDFLVNYLAIATGTYAFNIGGDRHNVLARGGWSTKLGELSAVAGASQSSSATKDAQRIGAALRDGDVDAVVLPYFDLVSYVPCGVGDAFSTACQGKRETAGQVLAALENDRRLESALAVSRLADFAVVRLRDVRAG